MFSSFLNAILLRRRCLAFCRTYQSQLFSIHLCCLFRRVRPINVTDRRLHRLSRYYCISNCSFPLIFQNTLLLSSPRHSSSEPCQVPDSCRFPVSLETCLVTYAHPLVAIAIPISCRLTVSLETCLVTYARPPAAPCDGCYVIGGVTTFTTRNDVPATAFSFGGNGLFT